MLSLWNYLRVRANEAILAGVMDALEKIEKGDIGNHHLESSNSLLKKLDEKPTRKLGYTWVDEPRFNTDEFQKSSKTEDAAATHPLASVSFKDWPRGRGTT